MGEDLILFRDGAGRPGLLHARCCHRGTTLYYGRVEPIRHPLLLPRLAVRQPKATASINRANPTAAASADASASRGIRCRSVTA